jgi:hypothetical protein
MSEHKLGEVAFIAHDDGSVSRTIIIGVALDGSADYLEYSYGPYHSQFKDAAAEATAKLKAKEKELEGALRAVREAVAAIAAPEYEQAVLKVPLRRRMGSPMWPMLDGKVTDVPAPKAYFEPGTRVFGVVSPSTHNTMQPHYRPASYFVLESTVNEARLLPDGAVSYRLDSYYRINELLFSDLDEAKRALARVFAEETGGSLPSDRIRVVSQDEEKAANDLNTKRIAEQVKSQFDRV